MMGNKFSSRRRRKPRLTFYSLFTPHSSSASTTSTTSSISSSSFDRSQVCFMDGFVKCLNDNYISQMVSNTPEKSQLLCELYFQLWQAHFLSPITTNLKLGGMEVLESGCGSADWIMSMAALYPDSNFTGIDTSRLFPTDCMPSNATFIQVDSFKELPFEDDRFDFIFAINLFAYIPEKQIENQVFPELVRVLKPGGWLEICDFDGRTVKEQGPIGSLFLDLASITLRNWGIRFLSAVEILTNEFEKYFENTHFESKQLCMNDYDESYLAYSQVILSMRRPLMEFTSMSSERFDEILKNLKVEYDEYRSVVNLCRLYAQKSRNTLSYR